MTKPAAKFIGKTSLRSIFILVFLIGIGLVYAQFSDRDDHVIYPDLAMDVEIPVNNLVAEYRFDECDWDGVPGEVRDEKLEHHGTIVGTPSTFQGRLCKGADFRGGLGDNYYVRAQNVLTDVSAFSIAFWIRLDNLNTNEVLSASKFLDSNPNTMLLSLDRDNVYTQLYDNQTAATVFHKTNLFYQDTWHHVVWVRDGLTQKLYVDRTEIVSAAPDLDNNALTTLDTLRMGSGNTGSNYDFDGLMDELKIFNVALTPTQVEQIYIYESEPPYRNSNATARVCSNCNVYGDWYFDNCYYSATEDSVSDMSGSGSTASIVGAPIASSGEVCRSVMLNGSDYFRVDNNNFNRIRDDITISAWIYKFNKPGADSYILSKGGKYYSPGVTDDGFQLYTTTDNRICWRLNGESTAGSFIYSQPALFNNQEWTYVAVTFKNETDRMFLYINGVVQDSCIYTGVINSNDNTLFLGWDSTNTANGFYGRIDEVRIYNEELNQDQIETIYNYQSSQRNANGLTRICYDCVPSPSLNFQFDDCGTYADQVADLSGNDNNGLATGNPFNAEGFLCQGCVMVGASRFEVADKDNLEGDRGLTLMGWVFIEENGSGAPRINTLFSKYNGSSGYRLAFMQPDSGHAQVWWDTDMGRTRSAAIIPNNVWTHVAVTYDGYYKRVFINGLLDSIAIYNTDPLDQTGENLYVGSEKSGTSFINDFNGKIDDIMVFKAPLSESQISKIYGYEIQNKNYDGSPRICVDCPPLAEWRFDECQWTSGSPDVKDSGPNGLNGTPINNIQPGDDGALCKGADFTAAPYISIPFDDRFNMVYDQIAISMWVNPRDAVKSWLLSLNEAFLNCNDPAGPFSMMCYEIALHNGQWVFQTTNDEWDPTPDCPDAQSNPNLPTYPATLNEWHYMVFSSDANYKRIYMDGVKVAEKDFGSRIHQVSNINMYLGTTGGSVGYGLYDGLMDEVALWNFPITDEKVMQMYQNSLNGQNYDGTQRDCGYCGIVSNWRFDECGWDNRPDEAVNQVTKTTSHRFYGTGFGTVQLDTADAAGNAVLNRALSFSAGDYVSIDNFDTLNGVYDYTFTIWIKPSEANNNVIFCGNNGSTDQMVMSLLDTRTIRTYFDGERTVIKDFQFPVGALSLDQWHQVVWARNYDTRRRRTFHYCYVDGQISGDTYNDRSPQLVNISSLIFGKADNTAGTNPFVGSMDEGIVFSSLLDELSISQMYNNFVAGKNFTGTYRFYNDCSPSSYWKMDECHWFSPPTKQAQNEASISLNATALHDMTTWSGQVCNAAKFDGVNDWLFTDPTTILAGKDAMSTSFFIRFDSLGVSGNQTVMVMGDTTETIQPTFMIDYINNELRTYVYSDDQNYYNANFRWVPNPGEWYHIAITFYKYRTEKIQVFLDGIQKQAPVKSTGTFTHLRDRAGRIFMGRYRPSIHRYLKGGMDEVRIYDYALTQNEIDALVTDVHPCTEDCGNIELLVYYKFDECNYIHQDGEVKDNADVVNLHASIGNLSDCYLDTGKVCRRAVFDGNLDYMQTEPSNFLGGKNELTVAAWINFDRLDRDGHIVRQFHYDDDAQENTNHVFDLKYVAADSSLQFWVYRDDAYIKKYSYPHWKAQTGKWYHISAVYDEHESNILAIYIDGQRVPGVNLNANNDIPYLPYWDERLIIGRSRITDTDENSFFWGSLDDMRIYGSALTDNQILDIYQDVLGLCPVCGSAALPPKTADWRFDRCSYDGSVDEVKDYTINYLDGYSVNVQPQLAVNKICRSAQFEGDDDIVIPDNTLLNFQNSMSIALWVYISPGNTVRTLVSKGYPADTGFILSVDSDNSVLWQVNDQPWDTNIILNENTWNHIVVTYNTDPLKRYLYVNGLYAANNNPISETILPNSNPVILGALQTGSSSYSNHFTGYMDNVALYSSALIIDHVEDIYKDTLSYCSACSGDTVSASTSLPKDIWKLIGIPAVAADGSPMSVVGDDIDGQVPSDTSYTWNLINYNAIDSSYNYFSEDPAGFQPFEPGRGFIIAQHLQPSVTLKFRGSAVITPFGYPLELPQPGLSSSMNLVANPFESMIRWNNVRVAQSGDTLSIAEAAAAGWVNSYAYVWESEKSAYYPVDPVVDSWYDRDTISTWEGYWVVNHSSLPIKLIYDREAFGKQVSAAIPKISPSGETLGSYSRNETISLTNRWVGLLSVSSPDMRYTTENNRFGIDEAARGGYDTRDALYFEPNRDKFVALYFDTPGYKLNYDLKNSDLSVRDWKFTIWNRGIPSRTWKLQLKNPSAFPGNIRISVRNSAGDVLASDLRSDPILETTVSTDRQNSYSLSVETVKDSSVSDFHYALMPVPFRKNACDLYVFPGEIMENMYARINGKSFSLDLADRLYNVYRTRLSMGMKSIDEIIFQGVDLSENIRRDSCVVQSLQIAANTAGSLNSADGRIDLIYNNAPENLLLSLGENQRSAPVRQDLNRVYSIQPYGMKTADFLTIQTSADRLGLPPEILNHFVFIQETDSGWVELPTRYHSKENTLSAPVERSGNYSFRLSKSGKQILPDKSILNPNYPNPFNGRTEFSFTVAHPGHVKIIVYDILGRRVAILRDTMMEAGIYRAAWDARSLNGENVSSGIYFLQLQNEGSVSSRKIMVLK